MSNGALGLCITIVSILFICVIVTYADQIDGKEKDVIVLSKTDLFSNDEDIVDVLNNYVLLSKMNLRDLERLRMKDSLQTLRIERLEKLNPNH